MSLDIERGLRHLFSRSEPTSVRRPDGIALSGLCAHRRRQPACDAGGVHAQSGADFALRRAAEILDGRPGRQAAEEGEQGRYILKPKLSDFRNRLYSAANENLTMQIAAQVFGIETAENGLCFFRGGEAAYIVKRFDVKPDGTKRRKEDFASLAGLTAQNGGQNYKYDVLTYEECGDLIRRYLPAWRVEMLKFFDLVVFNFLVCNGDAHLKNFSVLETESGDFRLAPAYDLINTKLHVDDRIFALDRGLLRGDAAAHTPFGMIGGATFMEFGKRLGLPEKTLRRELDRFCATYSLLDRLIRNSYLSDELKEVYRNMYLGRRDSYLKVGL